MRINKLFVRVFLAMWILSAVVLLVAGLFINRSLEVEFTDYVDTVKSQNERQIVFTIEDIFTEYGRSREALNSIKHLAKSERVRIQVWDNQGDNVIDTQGRGRPGSSSGRYLDDVSEGDSTTYPLVLNDTWAGEVVLTSLDRGPEHFTSEELDFKTQITNSIIMGGLISLVLSLLVSAIISLSISKPIQNLQKTANSLKHGDYSKRALVSGPEEIKHLSENFNSMAENIERSDYMKKKLTQDLSHELRNPVSTVRGYLEAFQDGVLLPNEENLSHTLEELNRLSVISEELHQLALVELEHIKVIQETVDLKDIGDKITKTIKPLIIKRDISFFYQADSVYIQGDSRLLYAVVKNLIQNSMNHTKAGEEIKLSVMDEDDHAVIQVKDTGSGISQDKLPYIFERFYRGDDARDRATGGSGLGLSLSKEWTRAMGGDIQVTSTLGEGTTFNLSFPKSKK